MKRITRPFVKSLFALIIGFLAISQSGCVIPIKSITCTYDFKTKTLTCSIVFGASFNDGLVGALVTDNTDVASNLQLSVDGTPVSLTSNLDDVQSGIIRDRLIAQGGFNPQTQHLMFFQTTGKSSISPASQVVISYTLQRSNGDGIVNGRTGFGGTLASLLTPGITPDEFFVFTQAVNPQGVPTLTEWGLILMSLLLATAGTIFILQRRWAMEELAVVNGGIQSDRRMLPRLFVPRVFGKALAATIVFVSVGLAVSVRLLGNLSALDIGGTMLCALIFAYVTHLLIVTTNNFQRRRK